mmetsp:Transcript_48248/g.114809  ORF Transcript_48248/g.114809 Transcript_48248/m.114809 type:complete len:269 (-) Transcript_48248:286-1092(-)
MVRVEESEVWEPTRPVISIFEVSTEPAPEEMDEMSRFDRSVTAMEEVMPMPFFDDDCPILAASHVFAATPTCGSAVPKHPIGATLPNAPLSVAVDVTAFFRNSLTYIGSFCAMHSGGIGPLPVLNDAASSTTRNSPVWIVAASNLPRYRVSTPVAADHLALLAFTAHLVSSDAISRAGFATADDTECPLMLVTSAVSHSLSAPKKPGRVISIVVPSSSANAARSAAAAAALKRKIICWGRPPSAWAAPNVAGKASSELCRWLPNSSLG